MKETKQKKYEATALEEDNKICLKETFIKLQFGIIIPVQKKMDNMQEDKDASRDWKV